MMKRTLGIVVILGGLSMAGCAGGYAYYSSAPPPPVRVEARGVAPGAGFVWVDGYWGYRGGNYAWVPGNWVRPPRGAWPLGNASRPILLSTGSLALTMTKPSESAEAWTRAARHGRLPVWAYFPWADSGALALSPG
jgi:hypothetical protein